MNKELFSYPSSDGHSRISAELYTPTEHVARAVVLLSHGMCEYVGRYQDFARFLCDNGIILCGNDHLGHKSTALLNREKLGYFGPFGSRRYLVEDTELLRQEIAERYPDIPCFLMGHSMGSFLARLYTARFGRNLAGLIISGTTGRNPAAPAGRLLARGLAAAKGPRHVSRQLFRLANGAYASAFPEDGPVGWLSRDRSIQISYLKDQYCTFPFTVSAYYELFAMAEECNKKAWYTAVPEHLPVFIFSGDGDPVGNMGTGPRQMYDGLAAIGHNDVTIRIYPGGRHEMLNEINKEEVYSDVLTWLNQVLARQLPDSEEL